MSILRENAEEYDCFIHDWDKKISFIVPLYNYEVKEFSINFVNDNGIKPNQKYLIL